MYSISEVSKIMNLPTSTIRYYDQEGLLPFIKRKTSGYRLFNDSDIDMLKLIECLKNTGMSIKEIKYWIDLVKLGDLSLQERYDFFVQHKKDIEQQISNLYKQMELIDHKVWYYQTALEAGTEAIHHQPHNEIVNKK